mmetsp:Transcript_33387/g.51220  ORF Transcript_33387/g.51220 Transcript_33387/m.51220 type:complete len:104 (+) Transcript_33387:447-758(+)
MKATKGAAPDKQSEPSKPSQSEGPTSVDDIQQQINLLKQILPKIKDAGKRAGLLQYFAPKIEAAMKKAEVETKAEEKASAEEGAAAAPTNFISKLAPSSPEPV